jgi:Rps23 Pro-64 3,4-dihydroxylase Tpa1-like proline 4-hydroxylase
VITAILYVNPDWVSDHGGCFRFWPIGGGIKAVGTATAKAAEWTEQPSEQPAAAVGALDLAPKAGRVLVFLSKVLPHEVMPAYLANRYAISLWMLQRE